jgi:hypothetical protein
MHPMVGQADDREGGRWMAFFHLADALRWPYFLRILHHTKVGATNKSGYHDGLCNTP